MPSAEPLSLRLLGEIELARGGNPVLLPASKKTRALLAYLAVTAKPHRRERLCELFWDMPDDPRGALRWSLSKLRPLVDENGAPRIVAERETVAFERKGLAIDWLDLQALGARGLAAAAVDELERAAAAFRGDFLEGLEIARCPEFEAWCAAERTAAHTLHCDVLRSLIRRHDADAERALPHARALVQLEPLDEAARADLVRLLHASGHRAEAERHRTIGLRVLEESGVRAKGVLAAAIPVQRPAAPPPASAPVQGGLASASQRSGSVPAVAVLPFADLSEEAGASYFAEGVTDDLINNLSRWRSFAVIARNSTFVYRGQPVDIRAAGRELGARYVIEGSVRRAGPRVRVTAQLADAETGRQLWSEQFERGLDDALKLQDDIARHIAATVAPELCQADQRLAAAKPPASFHAWDYMLRGWTALHRTTCPANEEARALFRRAIENDAAYAQAHASLAWSHLNDLLLDCDVDRAEALQQAFAASRRALELDELSWLAHFSLGTSYIWANEHDLAIAETSIASDLCPSNAQVCVALGNRLDIVGRSAEGIERMATGVRLNPRDPALYLSLCSLGRGYINARQYEAALEILRRAQATRPNHPHIHHLLAVCLGHLGRAEEARQAVARCDTLRPGFIAKRMTWNIYLDPAANRHLRDGLVKAGVAA